MLVFASAIGSRPQFHPAEWETHYTRLLQHELPYVREAALDNLPLPPSRALLKLLRQLLTDKDVDVQTAACRVAEKTKAPELREAVLQVMGSAREKWLLNAACNAAWALDIRLSRITVLVGRLDEEGMTAECLDHLASFVLSDRSSYSSPTRDMLDAATGLTCKEFWVKFLEKHGKELEAGKRFSLADPKLSLKDLFPGFTFDPPR